MSALYPDVPIYPGVPPVLRDDVTPPDAPLTDDAPTLPGSQETLWGIVDEGGAPIAEWDSVATFEYRSEKRISDYPVEGGQFESYNKVTMPYEIGVTLTCGGSDTARQNFLASIDLAVNSLDNFTVLMPELSFSPVSLVRYDFRRTSTNGATLLAVDVVCAQIRSDVTVAFTKSKAPASSNLYNAGSVQTTDAPSAPGDPQ